MLVRFLIMLREGMDAALIVGIVASYLGQTVDAALRPGGGSGLALVAMVQTAPWGKIMTKPKRRKQTWRLCPLCADPIQHRGLPLTIPCATPTYWSPEAALPIYELRDIVHAVYRTNIEDAARERRQTHPIDRPGNPDDELPF
jgi:high-affinity Fe2+/Pb2+ permease